ncbi:MAG: family transporter [Conexibacter sp.]|nr:family transporter [Conexibacter sp.]
MMAGTPSYRAIARVFFTVAALAGALYLLWLVRRVLGLVLISVFLAVALGPAVAFFARRGIKRALSILIVYLLLFASVVGIGLLVVPPIVTQVEGLAKDAPRYIRDIRQNKTVRKYDNRYHISRRLEQQAATLPSKLGSAAGTLSSLTVGVFSALVQLLTVLTMTFFLLLDGRRLVGFLFGLTGPTREPRLRRIADEIYGAVSGYVAGNLVISLIAGAVTYVTLTLLGVPFAVPLAILVGFLDLIPLVGATIGAVIVAIVTAFVNFPSATIVWVIVAVVYQQVENHLIQPLIYRRTVDVHPLVVIVAILIGAELLGVLGALVAIPIAAAIQIVARDAWDHRRPRVELPAGADVASEPGAAAPPETPSDAIELP